MILNKIILFLKFLDKRSFILLFFAALTGILLFFVELFLAYSLQSFLYFIIKRSPSNASALLDFIHLNKFESAFFAVLFFGLARGLLLWSQYILQGVGRSNAIFLIQKKILKITFFSKNFNSYESNVYLTEKTNNASLALRALQNMIMQFVTLIFLFFSLIYISLLGTLFVFLFLVFMVFPIKKLDFKINSIGIKSNIQWDEIHSKIFMNTKNLLFLHIYGTKRREYQSIMESLEGYYKEYKEFYKLSALKFALPQTLGVLSVCLITWFLFDENSFTSNNLIVYFYLFIRFIELNASLSKMGSQFILYWPQLEQVLGLKEYSDGEKDLEKQEISFPYLNSKLNRQKISWELKNITFSYSENEKKLFNEFSLSLPAFHSLGIEGASGSGKTTLIKIILGILTPQSGTVSAVIDGKNHSPRDSIVLNSLGYVGPEPFINNGTIIENIKYGLPFIPSELDIQEAIELSHCSFINQLKGRFNYKISEQGDTLSDGQKQRLSFCRALLRKPSVLFLDESTAFLDHENEQLIIESLFKLKNKITIILASHRKNMLNFCDHKIKL